MPIVLPIDSTEYIIILLTAISMFGVAGWTNVHLLDEGYTMYASCVHVQLPLANCN